MLGRSFVNRCWSYIEAYGQLDKQGNFHTYSAAHALVKKYTSRKMTLANLRTYFLIKEFPPEIILQRKSHKVETETGAYSFLLLFYYTLYNIRPSITILSGHSMEISLFY